MGLWYIPMLPFIIFLFRIIYKERWSDERCLNPRQPFLAFIFVFLP
jgi:hypothetical protein